MLWRQTMPDVGKKNFNHTENFISKTQKLIIKTDRVQLILNNNSYDEK